MNRKMMIVSAAVAAFAIATVVPSAAMHGGGGHMGGGHMGGGHWGGGHWGGGHWGGGSFAHVGMAHPGGAAFIRSNRVAFSPGVAGWHHHHAFRHRFFRHRFAFAFFGAPYAYDYYDDSCYSLVWTRWGWRRVWVCN